MIARHAAPRPALGERARPARPRCWTRSAGPTSAGTARAFPASCAGDGHPDGVAHRPAGRVPRGRPPHRRQRRRRSRSPAALRQAVRPRISSASFTADVEKVFHGIDELGSWDAVLDSEPALAVTLSPPECDAALDRDRPLRRPQVAVHARALAGRRPTSPPRAGASARAARRRGRTCCTEPAWSAASAGSACPTPSGTSRLRSPQASGSGYGCTRTSPSGCCTSPKRSRRSAGSPCSSANGSTVPATRAASPAPAITRPGRILAAADAYQAMREPRPHRAALRPPTRRPPSCGPRCAPGGWTAPPSTPCSPPPATASAAAATVRPGSPPARWRCCASLARGLSNKQIAARLVITPKTAGNHIEHIYTKIGATSRAEASLFAMQHGLLPDAHHHPLTSRSVTPEAGTWVGPGLDINPCAQAVPLPRCSCAPSVQATRGRGAYLQ